MREELLNYLLPNSRYNNRISLKDAIYLTNQYGQMGDNDLVDYNDVMNFINRIIEIRNSDSEMLIPLHEIYCIDGIDYLSDFYTLMIADYLKVRNVKQKYELVNIQKLLGDKILIIDFNRNMEEYTWITDNLGLPVFKEDIYIGFNQKLYFTKQFSQKINEVCGITNRNTAYEVSYIFNNIDKLENGKLYVENKPLKNKQSLFEITDDKLIGINMDLFNSDYATFVPDQKSWPNMDFYNNLSGKNE